ncbi:MAG TPA: hypothetical protein VNW26_10805 [Steroidobacteraceae bacterium]|jgi:hypothetical protein|nr:hypothetical protein [Steroidobacteraceae bacterium]
MQPTHVRLIREAIDAAQKFAHETTLDGCDAADIDEIAVSLGRELERPLPSAQMLATYMNSLVRSLRTQHHALPVVSQLQEVMSKSGIRADL